MKKNTIVFWNSRTRLYISIYEYLMQVNHQTMIHSIQEQINNVSNSNLILNSLGHDHDGGGGRRSSTNNCTVKCPSKVCQSCYSLSSSTNTNG